MSSVSVFENSYDQNKEQDSKKDEEVLKLIDNFFLKSALLICSKELSPSDNLREYVNLSESWFEIMENYQIYDLPVEINTWLHYNGKDQLPPLVIETYLDLRNLPETFLIRLMDKDGNLWNVCKGTKKTEIVLERWLLELDNSKQQLYNNNNANNNNNKTSQHTNSLNHQISLLLRYLRTLIELLPINYLTKTINKHYLSIGTRILDGSKPILSKGRIGLSRPIISSYSNEINETNIPSHLEQKKITPVSTKLGLLRVSVSYRKECKFELQNIHPQYDNESSKQLQQIQKSKTIINASPKSQTTTNFGTRKSTSISPSARVGFGIPGMLLEQQPSSLSKKSPIISRQVQPFKVGSVNSVAYEKSTSQFPSRNPSVSSVFVNASARRSSIGSNFANNNIINNNITANNNNILMANNSNSNSTVASNIIQRAETGSIESASKYLSSFGNIRRHSSINRNAENINSIDRALRSGSDVLMNPNRRNSGNNKHFNNSVHQHNHDERNPETENKSKEELLDFVKLIDSRPELHIKGKPSEIKKDGNISHSLLKYQNLKPSNDMLSEDLSMSYTLYSHNQDGASNGGNNDNNINLNKANYQGRRHSTSANYKSSLNSNLPYFHNVSTNKGINNHFQALSTSAINSRKNSWERNRQPFLPPIYGGESMSYHVNDNVTGPDKELKTGKNILLQDQGDNKRGRSQSNDTYNYVTYNTISNKGRSSRSPRSLGSLPSHDLFNYSDGKHRLTYRQNFHLSQPTLMSVPAQAKLHRPDIQSADILEDEGRRMSHVGSAGTLKNNAKNKERRNYTEMDDNPSVDVDNEVEDDDLMFFMSDMNIGSEC